MPTNHLTFLLIPVDGEPTALTAPADQQGAYNAVRAAIGGGWLEAHAAAAPAALLFVDEDGKQHDLPLNPRATEFMRPVLRSDDYISGPAVLTGPETAAGEWASINPDYVREHFGVEMPA